MMETIFQFGISNATIACLLAIVAYSVGVYANRPKLTHLLWVLVLVKLVTPPIFNLPLSLIAAPPEFVATEFASDKEPQGATVAFVDQVHHASEMERGNLAASEVVSASFWNTTKPWLGVAWLLGTISVLLISIARIVRFHLLLKRSAQQNERKLLTVGERLAQQLGLRKMPTIMTTTANISPMVWWVGGDVKIVLPQSVMDKMSDEQCRLILAHEMAHICRRDYLVRWLEWLARVAFWWNPIVWWAQRNLRVVEETCCDELVLTKLKPNEKTYASTILTTVESLVSPVIRPPAMASEINSGGFLERRIEKILTRDLIQQPTRRRSVLAVCFALLVIPFGFVDARDTDQEHQQIQTAEHEVDMHDHDQDGRQKTLVDLVDLVEMARMLRETAETVEAARSAPDPLAALDEAFKKQREDNKYAERVVAQATDQEHQQGQTAEHEATMRDHDENVRQKALAEFARVLKERAETIEAANRSGPEALAALKESYRKQSEDNKRKRRRRVIDYEAITRKSTARIEAAVAKGELTKEEGDVELLKSTENIELLELAYKLNNLVEAGELTENEARMRLDARLRE